MKFISKNNNLGIVLRQGVPAERLSGRAAVAGLYVKFIDGFADVVDEQSIKLMLNHPGFNIDFIKQDENEDPFSSQRKNSEPRHDLTEIKYGTVGKVTGDKSKIGISPEQKVIMVEMAKEMAKEMAMKIAPELAKEIIADNGSKKEESAVEKDVNKTPKAEENDTDKVATDSKSTKTEAPKKTLSALEKLKLVKKK